MGEHPPQRFVKEQAFCQVSFLVFIGVIITLSGVSAGMDSGGSFSVPYFISGFILSPVLVANLISRRIVVCAVTKKGLSRKNIVDTLNNSTCGKIIWPWSCRLGMLLCIPGTILTGIGGVNCEVRYEPGITVIKNTCYYDIEGETSGLYRGLAIGLIVLHIFLFVFLIFSNCPVQSVLDQIKEDPLGNEMALTRSTATPAATQSQQAVSNISNETDLIAKVRRLETRLAELEEREAEARQFNIIPPPPSYSELLATEGFRGSGGANPV